MDVEVQEIELDGPIGDPFDRSGRVGVFRSLESPILEPVYMEHRLEYQNG